MKKNISMAVIKRLPKYHRYLAELIRNKVQRISSKELSERMGLTASQIRQDLNCFGDFGQQGYGYNVIDLHKEISALLGLTREYKTIIIGAGNIGQAIANYTRFNNYGFKLDALFDVNPKLVGLSIVGIEIQDVDMLADYLEKNAVDIGIICVPKKTAQDIANLFVKNNVKAIWNFAPLDLELPEEVVVENVHLSESLLTLTYRLNEIME